MDILKIGVLAVLLHGVGHADIMEVVGGPPPAHIKQICEGIVERGNIALEYFEEMTKPGNCGTFEFCSNNWYIANNVDSVLSSIINHPNIFPFLKYQHSGDNITDVELSFNNNTNIPNNMLQKAIALLPSATRVTMPLKKLPAKIPKNWKKDPLSLSAPGLKHINSSAFYSSYSDYYNILSLDLPSLKSIGKEAFYFCKRLKKVSLPDALKFINKNAVCNFLKKIILN